MLLMGIFYCFSKQGSQEDEIPLMIGEIEDITSQ